MDDRGYLMIMDCRIRNAAATESCSCCSVRVVAECSAVAVTFCPAP